MIDICFDCKYYVDGMCTQYDMVVAPTDGCSNGEKKGAIRNMKKAELLSYVGKKVIIYFKGNERCEYGTLGFADEFSAKHDYRKPGYFYINDISFRVSHVKKVIEDAERGFTYGD